ncbi:MAG: hypothetical protein IJ873_05750 [Lachnospiraceae bacterium]|nr:hypothetical protein [Lachnospiraceae bacterium]
MKELWNQAVTAYMNYRGTGKLFVLFAVALLFLYLLYKSTHKDAEFSRYHPAVFLLSVRTGISYAFARVLKGPESRSGPRRTLYNFIVILFCVIAVILSGKRVFSEEFYTKAENTLHIRTSYVYVMVQVLKDAGDENVIKIAAPPNISPWLRPYSSRFLPVYDYPKNGDVSILPENARIIYNQFSTSVPDMRRITKAAKAEGCSYLIYDTGKYYPEFKPTIYGYELIDTADTWEIDRLSEESEEEETGTEGLQ